MDPTKLAMRFKFRPPGSDFAFGTDNFGRSLWSRVVWGAQLSVIIGFSVVALNAVFGTLIGALAGYFRPLDNALMRVNDALMAFPAILLAIGITAVLGPSTLDAILALMVPVVTASVGGVSLLIKDYRTKRATNGACEPWSYARLRRGSSASSPARVVSSLNQIEGKCRRPASMRSAAAPAPWLGTTSTAKPASRSALS